MTDFLEIIRGDVRTLNVTGLVDEDGASIVFAPSDVLWWTAKRRYRDPDSRALIQKTSADGGITIDVGQDTAEVNLVPADFEGISLNADLDIVWDLQIAVLGDATQIVTLDRGTGRVLADVTLVTA